MIKWNQHSTQAVRAITHREPGSMWIGPKNPQISQIHFTNNIVNIFFEDGSVLTVYETDREADRAFSEMDDRYSDWDNDYVEL